MFRTVASSSSKMERLSKFVAAKQICATSYRYSTPIRSSSQYMRRAIYAQYMSTRAPYLHTIECFAGQKTERGGIMIADIPTNVRRLRFDPTTRGQLSNYPWHVTATSTVWWRQDVTQEISPSEAARCMDHAFMWGLLFFYSFHLR